MEGYVLRRRRHSAAFKARVLEACSRPGASIAGVALEHGLNANVVHKWRRQAAEGQRIGKDVVPVTEFVPLPILPAPEREVGNIHIAIRRGSTSLDIQWPVSNAQACARWLGEVLK